LRQRQGELVREAQLRLGAVLLAAAAAIVAAGCSVGDERPKEIPPPVTPTDVREAHRITGAHAVYSRDEHLIETTRRSCSRGLPTTFFQRVCGPELRPLVAQQRTHLREGLDDLERRVGRLCAAALRRVAAVPSTRAGRPLGVAARVCRHEYRRAARSG
jgi:hypothetical protein